MMAQPQGHDLLFALGDLQARKGGYGVATATRFRAIRQLL